MTSLKQTREDTKNKLEKMRFRQCRGSVTFWYGSGCGSDPRIRTSYPDTDPGGPTNPDPYAGLEHWYI
jgi:hypothetical protein